MEQLLLHLLGDYVLQNNWMANNKKNSLIPCLVHCILYSLPFLLITSWSVVLVILGTHMILDGTNVLTRLMAWKNRAKTLDYFGCKEGTPPWLSLWLLIIVDNTFHLAINYFVIKYLGV